LRWKKLRILKHDVKTTRDAKDRQVEKSTFSPFVTKFDEKLFLCHQDKVRVDLSAMSLVSDKA
jgi:hypothetical protein